MFDEPNEEPIETSQDPSNRAREKADEFRMHAEIFAIFEGRRKFDAEFYAGLDAQIARDVQRTMGRLEKSRTGDDPVLPASMTDDAASLLSLPADRDISTNDYHIHRRPGEVMIVRWLAGEQVDTFYDRLQAHFDAALEGCKEDERQASEWKQDPKTLAFLAALEKIEVPMAERYRRDEIRKQKIFVLSTQTADEMNIAYLTDYVMASSPVEIVGSASAPPDEPAEKDLAWFYKLYALRGIVDDVERMCFFTYLQKSDDESW